MGTERYATSVAIGPVVLQTCLAVFVFQAPLMRLAGLVKAIPCLSPLRPHSRERCFASRVLFYPSPKESWNSTHTSSTPSTLARGPCDVLHHAQPSQKKAAPGTPVQGAPMLPLARSGMDARTISCTFAGEKCLVNSLRCHEPIKCHTIMLSFRQSSRQGAYCSASCLL